MAAELTQEERDNLTEEEVLAIEGDGGTEEAEEKADDVTDKENADVEEEPETGNEADDLDGEGAENAESDTEEQKEEAPKVEEASDTEDKNENKPDDNQEGAAPDTVEAGATEEKLSSKDRLDAIDSELDGLGELVESGDLSFPEYHKKLTELNKGRQDLVTDIRDEHNNQTRRADDWRKSVDEFIAEDVGHKQITENSIVQKAFQEALQQVSQSNDAAGKSDAWRLGKAKDLMGELGINLGAPKKQVVEKKQPVSRKPDVKLPKTLGDAQASNANDNSEFSSLEGLDGIDFEEALAKLSPSQQDRWLESA